MKSTENAPSARIRAGLHRLKGWCGCLGLWLSLTLAALGAPSFTATLDRTTISVDETVVLHLIFTDLAPPDLGNIQVPDGLEVLGRSTGQNIQIVNGQASRTYTFDYGLRPTKPGDYTIPGYHVAIDGKGYRTQPLQLKVTPSNLPGGEDGQKNELAFLRLVAPKNTFYVGESAVLEAQLYVAGQLRCEYPTIKAEGFMLGTNGAPQEGDTRLRNRAYRYVVFRAPVTAMSAGATNLGPAEINTLCVLPTGRYVRGFFFGDPQPETVERRLHLVSEPVAVKVLPLPSENVPQSFKGAVGSYTMKVTAGPTNVAAGDPITLRVELSGEGNLGTLDLPAPDLGAEFKVYPPTLKTEITDGLGLKGTKTFEWVVVPQNSDVRQLPGVEFSFFDPTRRAYRTLTHSAQDIVVRPAGSAAPPPSLAGNEEKDRKREAAQDIANIKARPGVLAARTPPWVTRGGFLAAQLIPLAALGAALARLLLRRHKERNPKWVRQRQVYRWVDKTRTQLGQLAARGEAEAFYATLFRLLQEVLGERLDLPAQAITAAVLEEALRPQGFAEEPLRQVEGLFARCDQARYAPAGSSADLAEVLRQLEAVLPALRSFQPQATPRAGSARAALTVLTAVVWGSAAHGAPAFERGNEAYAEGKFAAAIASYEVLLKEGLVSAPLYFNLGNAYYKQGQLGSAIACYRLALELAPRDTDAFNNLQMARVRANATTPYRLPWWREWTQPLSLNQWTAVAMALGWALAAVVAVRLWRGHPSPGLARATRWLAALWLIPLVGMGLRLGEYLGPAPAVVVAKEAAVRYGPLEESRGAFVLADGAEVWVTDRQGDWLQVRDSASRTGWLKRNQLFVLRGG